MRALAILRSLPARPWRHAPPRQSSRSLAMVRISTALLLLVHPIYALAHPAELRSLGALLTSHGWPMGMAAATAVCLLQAASSLALLWGRLLVPACVGHLVVLGAGIWLVHAPKWYVVGGASEEGHPGAEYSVLLMACLLSVLWAHLRKGEGERAFEKGMDGVRIASALILSAHPLHGLAHPANLRAFGEGMSSIGFPFGVQLVWLTMFIQVAGALGLTLRRYVVLASLGLMFVNTMGIAIAHFPQWFVVGPGENGMEYSLLLITCFAATLLSHWPSREESGATRSEWSPALP